MNFDLLSHLLRGKQLDLPVQLNFPAILCNDLTKNPHRDFFTDIETFLKFTVLGSDSPPYPDHNTDARNPPKVLVRENGMFGLIVPCT